MKTKSTLRQGFTLVELLVVIVIIASLAALSAPMIMGQVKKAAKTEAISNSKQIALAMFEFDNDYGSFPDADTLIDLGGSFPTPPPVTGAADANSNGYFRQLIHAGIVQSEEIFYAKTAESKKPDGNMSSNTEALAAKECGFGYIMDTDDALSSSGNPSRVIVVTPLASGSTAAFDAEPLGGFAIALKIDQSASALRIRTAPGATTGIAIAGGADLMAADFWGDITPTIKGPIE